MSLQTGNSGQVKAIPTGGEGVVRKQLEDLEHGDDGPPHKKAKTEGGSDTESEGEGKVELLNKVRPDAPLTELPLEIETPCNIYFYARTQAGKSSMIRSVMHQMNYKKRWHSRIVFTDTKETGNLNDFASDKKLVLDRCNDGVIRALRKEMKKPVNRSKQMLLLFDDFSCGNWDMNMSKEFKGLAQTGRNDNITLMMAAQTNTSIPSKARKNALYLFLGANFDQEILDVAKQYAVANLPRAEMTLSLRALTNRASHEFLFIPVREGRGPYLMQAAPEHLTGRPGSDTKKQSCDGEAGGSALAEAEADAA